MDLSTPRKYVHVDLNTATSRAALYKIRHIDVAVLLCFLKLCETCTDACVCGDSLYRSSCHMFFQLRSRSVQTGSSAHKVACPHLGLLRVFVVA